jgi:outer membrane lipoprotein-sorting protein
VSATADAPEPPTSGSVPGSSATAKASGTAVAIKPTATATAQPTAQPTAPPEPQPTAPVALGAPVAGSADEVAFNIDKIFKDATRWKAGFIQKHKQKINGVEREQKGTVFVERPNKISFRYDAPNKNRIVSDGTTLKLYVAEDQQMFEHPVKKTEYPGAFGFIMGNGIRPSFEFSYNDKVKFALGPILIGKPRTPNPQYEQVLFYIDKDKLEKGDPNAVNGVLILDAQGNKNRFELHDASFPTSIDASEFSFTPPAGTNITK